MKRNSKMRGGIIAIAIAAITIVLGCSQPNGDDEGGGIIGFTFTAASGLKLGSPNTSIGAVAGTFSIASWISAPYTYALVAGSGGNDVDNAKFEIENEKLKIKTVLQVAKVYKVYLQVSDSEGKNFSKGVEFSIAGSITGVPAEWYMGVPLDLTSVVVNLPEAPDKTAADIVWARNSAGADFAAETGIYEDHVFYPETFGSTTLWAIVADGDGKDDNHSESFTVNFLFPPNPFIGSWTGSDSAVWTFKTNGTFGRDAVADYGSFAVWSGAQNRKFMIAVTGDPDEITVTNVTQAYYSTSEEAKGAYQAYSYELGNNFIKITPITFEYDAANKQDAMLFESSGAPITLTRISGEPAPLDLSGSVQYGDWKGGFSENPFTEPHAPITSSPGLHYYANGSVRQNYDGAWLNRGAVHAIVGAAGRRWDPPVVSSRDTIHDTSGGEIVIIHEYRPEKGGPFSRGTSANLYWNIQKVQ
ncbi:hypothetical protein [Leadbettera azotonutricia]|uniref:Putative lipoprotein n=1 Tax=Leadbettera azotonutricia (strain ATCC BAA-888 / DSM 13862 / ZAS-9) TaxID=545695 RepID=F5Y725_LEAAZ|nr:hypothetical protein [Leadbettera azotonutricia]AEF80688.1 putative lipoprotein [Leadbettera azotonutricia ZAS-9]